MDDIGGTPQTAEEKREEIPVGERITMAPETDAERAQRLAPLRTENGNGKKWSFRRMVVSCAWALLAGWVTYFCARDGIIDGNDKEIILFTLLCAAGIGGYMVKKLSQGTPAK